MNKTRINKCRLDTLLHKREVAKNINIVIGELMIRAQTHDDSKLESPEIEVIASDPDLNKITYGSPEYEESLKQIQPALEHHYSKNRHHIEHWAHGIEDMNLVDLIELLSDWCAATKRLKSGNIQKSLEYNVNKYNIPPQLAKIFENTIRELYQ